MGLTVGVDVGGTKIAAGVVDEKGAIVQRVRRESPAADSEAIEETIADLVRELAADHDVVGVGVGAAGFVDVTRSTVLFAPNLAWRDEPLKAELERRLGLPVVIENDANAAAWGEFAFGAGADADDLLLVTVGTGVGGGIVLGRQAAPGGVRGGRRDRPPARRAGRAALSVRQPGLLGAVRQRLRARSRRSGAAPVDACGGAGFVDRAGGDVRGDHRSDDHRGGEAGRSVRRRSPRVAGQVAG